MKRTRDRVARSDAGGAEGAAGAAGAEGEEPVCPVCLERIRTQMKPFQCDHVLCRTCDNTMKQTSDNRCPVCRAPRKGMSREQAQPDPDRNRDPHDPPDVLLPEQFDPMMAEIANGVLSFAAGLYGRPGRLALTQVSRGVVHRPNTGHILFFRNETAVDAGDAVGPALVVDETQADGPAGRMSDDQARTFASILGVDADALQALLSVPEVSIHEWQRMRENQRGRSARRRGT